MNLAIDQPWWLMLSLVGVVSGAIGWRWMKGIPRFRRGVAVSLRVTLFLVLALALGGVYRVEEAEDLAIIAVVDVSGSVQSFGSFGEDELGLPITIDRAARGFLERASIDRRVNDRLGVVAFDGRRQVVSSVSRSSGLDRAVQIQPIEGSDIAGAIGFARAQLPPDAQARIVLISDGRTTSESLSRISVDAPVDVVPVVYSVDQEVIVESVDIPARSLAGSVVDVRVVVRSIEKSIGGLQLIYNNQILDLNGDKIGELRAVALEPGRQVIVIPVQLGDSRVHRFEAKYIAESGDTSEENNYAGAVTMTSGDGHVLVVAQRDDAGDTSADSLLSVLDRIGWEVNTISPGEFPLDLLELEKYGLVVLVDTPRDAVGLEADGLLDAYVRELGGGLIMVGGGDALGAGGWQGSTLEGILPVKLDVADDLIVPAVAVVLVLDSSGSMRNKVMGSSRSQQSVANGSAVGAVEVLDEKDLVGVVAFSNTARTVVPIGPNDQPNQTRSRITSISSSGGTNMGPALSMARDMLTSVDAGSKHIVLLSDGESQNPEMLPALAEELGELGIKVSTIAVGDGADEEGMLQIAQLSGGKYYRVRNPGVLPRVFLKAIRVVRTPMVREGVVTPIVLENDSPATGRIGSLPELSGLVMSEQIADDPRISTPIVSSRGEPIFAFHQVELGRVAVFTSDVSRWSRQWIESDVFPRFWTNATTWAMRSDQDEPGELSLIVKNNQAQIVYDAVNEEGSPIDGLDVAVQVFDALGQSRSVDLIQVESGRYTGSIDRLGAGVHVVIASPQLDGNPLQPTVAGLQIIGVDEFKHLSADPQSLIALANRTGGRVFDLGDPASANLFDRIGLVERQTLQPIWPILLMIAFALFVLDLGARRVAFDRWIAQARDETIAVSRGVLAMQAEQLKATKAATQARTVDTPKIDRSPMKVPKEETPAKPVSTEPNDDSNPLLAAKRRARERMNED